MADSITREELAAIQAGGGEVEVEPQRITVEGLVESLAHLVPRPADHSEIVGVLNQLVERVNTTVSCDPVVESVNHNQVVVDTTPILRAVEKLCQRPNYQFTVNRNARGQIESMDARIVE